MSLLTGFASCYIIILSRRRFTMSFWMRTGTTQTCITTFFPYYSCELNCLLLSFFKIARTFMPEICGLFETGFVLVGLVLVQWQAGLNAFEPPSAFRSTLALLAVYAASRLWPSVWLLVIIVIATRFLVSSLAIYMPFISYFDAYLVSSYVLASPSVCLSWTHTTLSLGIIWCFLGWYTVGWLGLSSFLVQTCYESRFFSLLNHCYTIVPVSFLTL
ncbi:hypothetical protein BJ508DRAFT_121463 [Ascobolus immersus RN42]|uniref:Uncharacterized protein n=1 Tax=Ascobolus immersus RN42 TaxID=1160509 RepID=A0A3N4IRM5_ASCIM|nr:hypothetical protein BJ508DRAFT_121463 [Ascobolus immersus RN42]